MNPFNWVKVVSVSDNGLFNEELDTQTSSKIEKSNKAGNELIKQVPDDAVAIILSFTPAHEFTSMSLVSRQFLEASKSETAGITKQIPSLKQIKGLFNKRTQNKETKMSTNLFPPDRTDTIYGKVIKKDNGSLDVILTKDSKADLADFCIYERIEGKKIDRSLLNQLLTFGTQQPLYKLNTISFRVKILNDNLDQESKQIIRTSRLFLTKLIEKNVK